MFLTFVVQVCTRRGVLLSGSIWQYSEDIMIYLSTIINNRSNGPEVYISPSTNWQVLIIQWQGRLMCCEVMCVTIKCFFYIMWNTLLTWVNCCKLSSTQWIEEKTLSKILNSFFNIFHFKNESMSVYWYKKLRFVVWSKVQHKPDENILCSTHSCLNHIVIVLL